MNALPRLLRAWMLLLLLAGAAHAQWQPKQVPPLWSLVTDEAGMLTPDQHQQLERTLAGYHARTGSQIAVLLVTSTAPEAIEQYGIRVADAWKLGRKGVDDGVLVLVAKDNSKALRRLRIEAGRGVQGVLTDAQSKRILQDTIAPHFREQDWYGGLDAGVAAIQALLDQEKFPAPRRHTGSPIVGYVVLAIFVLLVAGMICLAFVLRRAAKRNLSRRKRRRDTTTVDDTPAFAFASSDSASSDSSSDSDTSGDGGTFDGGGASGDWSD
jgi:uncharacterized protein